MPLQVQVALIGDPDKPITAGVLDEAFYEMPYRMRRKVGFDVDPEETLAAVLGHAADLMGLRPPDWMGGRFQANGTRVAFYKPEDEEGFAQRKYPRVILGELVLVDQDGRAIFGVHDHRTVSFRDLLLAAEAGTLDGDPLRPYLNLDLGWGDAPPVDWATVYEGLQVAWEVLKAVGVVGGAVTSVVAAKRWLAERLDRAQQTLAAHPEWMHKGYRPDQFARLVATRDWTADQLAPLLGCTEDEAEAILWALGFALEPDTGRWEEKADEAAEMFANIVRAVGWASHGGPGWEPRFRGWLMRYLETGQAPAFESMRQPSEDDEDWHYKPTPGERLDGFLARWRR
jgi:hypothetical protein